MPPLPAGVHESPAATTAWQAVHQAIAEELPETAMSIWVDPLELVGEVQSALCLHGPQRVVTWTRRRYGAQIGRLVRDLTDYRGAFIAIAPGPEGESGGLL